MLSLTGVVFFWVSFKGEGMSPRGVSLELSLFFLARDIVSRAGTDTSTRGSISGTKFVSLLTLSPIGVILSIRIGLSLI